MLRARFVALAGALTLQAAPAQVTWTQSTPANAPSARSAHDLVWDAARGEVVLFGGATGDPANPTPLADTWTWDGRDWRQQTGLAPKPPARWYHAMAYDAARQRVVLFGGWDGVGANHGDTWEWDGTRWSQVASGGPPARRGHAMAWDSARRRVVLFGGATGSYPAPVAQNDVWEWTGQSWIPVAAPASPPARFDADMAYDAASGQVLLMGGVTAPNVFVDDTWAWDGSRWTQQFPSVGAPYRAYHALAFDSTRGRVVAFGGADSQWVPRDDTWEWDGRNWERRSPATRPGGRWDHQLAYDADRDRVVLFGGYSGTGFLSDTWEYAQAPAATFSAFGSGCAGSAGTPRLGAAFGQLPWLGSTFTVEITSLPSGFLNVPVMMLGASRTTWAGTPLPLDLTSIGMPGCSLRVEPTVMLTLANQSGRASLSLSLPNQRHLLGARLFLQGLVVDPGANPLGITLSNAAEARIGGR